MPVFIPFLLALGGAVVTNAIAGAAFAGASSAVQSALADDAPRPATPEMLEAVFAVLDSCPTSDPAMRRYKADLLSYIENATEPEILAMRDNALIEAQARCADAMREQPAPSTATASIGPPAQVPPPPDGAPAWYWLVFAVVTALIIIGKPGKGGKGGDK